MARPRPGPAPAPPLGEQLPARVTMPLLALITQQSLDEDYLHAAERRAARGEAAETPRGRPHRVAAVVVAVFGVLVTTAAVQNNRNADVDDAGRASLIRQIGDQRDAGEVRQDRIARLIDRNSLLEQRLDNIVSAEQGLDSEMQALRISTGAVPVQGPGIRITVDDPPRGDEAIRKEDLFLLIDALRQAGAEAIALDGHRLGPLTSINNSSVAINVGASALIPPYTLEAIGDVETLAADMVDTASYAQFRGLQERYGFSYDQDNVDVLELPAAREKRLVAATELTTKMDHLSEEGSGT